MRDREEWQPVCDHLPGTKLHDSPTDPLELIGTRERYGEMLRQMEEDEQRTEE